MRVKKVLILGANFENKIGMEYGVARAFVQLGFDVITISYRKLNFQDLMRSLDDINGCDILLTIKGEKVSPLLISEFNANLKILWFQDDLYWGNNLKLLRSISWAYDIVFYFDKSLVNQIKEFHPYVYFLPLGVSLEVFQKSFKERIYDVSFPCSIIGERTDLAYILKGYNGVIGWTNDYINVLNSSKLIVNWPVTSASKGTQQRVFEAAACGCLVITKDMPDKYKVVKNVVYVKDYNELIWRIFELLNNEYKMKKIVDRLETEIVLNHTYVNRVKNMLKIIKEAL